MQPLRRRDAEKDAEKSALYGWWAAVLFVLFLGTTSVRAAEVDHDPFDRLLKEHVRDERVDYVGLRDRHIGELKAYLDHLATVDAAALSREEQLACYINLYNATMIQAVLDRYRDDYSPSEGNFKVFDEPLVRLKGRTVSLNHLEHEIIRKQFADPRIHAALVCAAVSCPPLLSRAYRANDLDRTLEENMRRFVNDPKRNVFDDANRTARLSSIFDWYAADFGGKDKLLDYVGRYRGKNLAGWTIEFLPYDWTLNRK